MFCLMVEYRIVLNIVTIRNAQAAFFQSENPQTILSYFASNESIQNKKERERKMSDTREF